MSCLMLIFEKHVGFFPMKFIPNAFIFRVQKSRTENAKETVEKLSRDLKERVGF